jgi:hypothetical protein
MRKLAHPVLAELRQTRAGKLMMDVFASDFDTVVMHAPRSYQLFLGVGRYATERVAPGHARVIFREYPGYLETYDTGVVEGAMQAYRVTGTAVPTRTGLLEGHTDVRRG